MVTRNRRGAASFWARAGRRLGGGGELASRVAMLAGTARCPSILFDSQHVFLTPTPSKWYAPSRRVSGFCHGLPAGEGKTVRTSQRRICWAAGHVLALLVPTPVEAYDLSAGVSLGWLQAGTVPRLAVGPHAGITWPIQRDIVFTVHDLCTFLPPTPEGGPGVYNQISVDVGYAWKDGNVSAGPSVAFYVMPACGVSLCGLVGGLAVSAHARPADRRRLRPGPGSPRRARTFRSNQRARRRPRPTGPRSNARRSTPPCPASAATAPRPRGRAPWR
ncbi:uncharacterized protein SOCEGT47_061450 [Sorangium cellulosum]|uniref:Uncharacterized protein n=1 Tax=Sorangium cellulosum TaxID=56 RepID=A0A4P2Q7U0_SORCE|nr:uncharacterized protein SOCEGT47_061450 [Sorangium cellulosum]